MMTLDANNVLPKLSTFYGQFPKRMDRAASMAVNEAARFGRAEAAREIRRQVNFPARYLNDGANGRLKIGRKATPALPEAQIVARHRPTSLRQFVTGISRRSKYVSVRVKPGSAAQKIPGAFVAKLHAGTEAGGNEGLAIRLKPGATFRGGKGIKLREDKHGSTWLMYGPSVNQVFNTVREDVAPAIIKRLDDELTRQVKRLGFNG